MVSPHPCRIAAAPATRPALSTPPAGHAGANGASSVRAPADRQGPRFIAPRVDGRCPHPWPHLRLAPVEPPQPTKRQPCCIPRTAPSCSLSLFLSLSLACSASMVAGAGAASTSTPVSAHPSLFAIPTARPPPAYYYSARPPMRPRPPRTSCPMSGDGDDARLASPVPPCPPCPPCPRIPRIPVPPHPPTL